MRIELALRLEFTGCHRAPESGLKPAQRRQSLAVGEDERPLARALAEAHRVVKADIEWLATNLVADGLQFGQHLVRRRTGPSDTAERDMVAAGTDDRAAEIVQSPETVGDAVDRPARLGGRHDREEIVIDRLVAGIPARFDHEHAPLLGCAPTMN